MANLFTASFIVTVLLVACCCWSSATAFKISDRHEKKDDFYKFHMKGGDIHGHSLTLPDHYKKIHIESVTFHGGGTTQPLFMPFECEKLTIENCTFINYIGPNIIKATGLTKYNIINNIFIKSNSSIHAEMNDYIYLLIND